MFQKSSWRFPKSKKGEAKLERGKKEALICRDCESFYWHKSWRHNLDNCSDFKENKNLRSSVCPSCQMIKDERYEGEVIIENLAEQKKEEIENLITNFSEIAFSKDPMDRIISIETIAKGMLRVLTTENQMAQRLAKKIKRTFKGKVTFLHSKKEPILRVKIVLK